MKVEKKYTANKKKMEQFVSTGIKYGDSEEARDTAIQTIALAWGESAAESVASQDLVQFMPETVRGNAMSCTPLNTSSMFTEEHQPRQPRQPQQVPGIALTTANIL